MTAREMIARVKEAYPSTLPDSAILALLQEAEARLCAEDPLRIACEWLPVNGEGRVELPAGVRPYMVQQVDGLPLALTPGTGRACKSSDGVFLPPGRRAERARVVYRRPPPTLAPESELTLDDGYAGCYLYYALAKLELWRGNIGGYNNYSALLESLTGQYTRAAVQTLSGSRQRFVSEV